MPFFKIHSKKRYLFYIFKKRLKERTRNYRYFYSWMLLYQCTYHGNCHGYIAHCRQSNHEYMFHQSVSIFRKFKENSIIGWYAVEKAINGIMINTIPI